MITLIIGKPKSGKTQWLINKANKCDCQNNIFITTEEPRIHLYCNRGLKDMLVYEVVSGESIYDLVKFIHSRQITHPVLNIFIDNITNYRCNVKYQTDKLRCLINQIKEIDNCNIFITAYNQHGIKKCDVDNLINLGDYDENN